jgi:hypothetical protein
MSITRKGYGRDIKPGGAQERTFVVRVTLAADAVTEIPLLVSHQDLYLYKAYLINDADVAQHDTNYRQFALLDKGAAGGGSTAASTPKSTKVTGGYAISDFVDWDLLATEGYLLTAGNVLSMTTAGGGTDPAIDGVVVIVCK